MSDNDRRDFAAVELSSVKYYNLTVKQERALFDVCCFIHCAARALFPDVLYPSAAILPVRLFLLFLVGLGCGVCSLFSQL
jgi:hypothetical protein